MAAATITTLQPPPPRETPPPRPPTGSKRARPTWAWPLTPSPSTARQPRTRTPRKTPPPSPPPRAEVKQEHGDATDRCATTATGARAATGVPGGVPRAGTAGPGEAAEGSEHAAPPPASDRLAMRAWLRTG